jgi:hypothetical protein
MNDVDRTALRGRIAEAFARYDWSVNPAHRNVTPNADHYDLADAVLAALPEPAADQPQESCGTPSPHATHKFMRGRAVHQCPGQDQSAGRPELDHPDDRRERYAAAIYGSDGEYPWGDLRREDQSTYYPYADAAMAVADAEYRAYDQWVRQVEDENARLRAGLAAGPDPSVTDLVAITAERDALLAELDRRDEEQRELVAQLARRTERNRT